MSIKSLLPFAHSKIISIAFFTALILLIITGLLLLSLYLRAERLPDQFHFNISLKYDCVKYARIKGDQIYVNKQGKRSGCGVPNAIIEFLDDHGKLIRQSKLNKKGKYYKSYDLPPDSPENKIRRIRFISDRCGTNQYAIKALKKHNFIGESMAHRRYRYYYNYEFTCQLIGK